ncbi:hypothetical protein BANRA_05393 [Escherichia coli]|nr:hypothetical protein BANRA_05393 [Escherichia coli]
MRRKVHYVIEPQYLWGNIAEMARKQDDELLRTTKGSSTLRKSPSPAPSGACSRRSIWRLTSWARPHRAQRPPVQDHRRDRQGLVQFSTDSDTLGDAYEYLIGQFAAGSGKKAGEFYTPQRISDILSAIVTLDSQELATGKRSHLDSVFDFACGSGSLLLNVRRLMGPHGIGKIHGQEEHHHLQRRMNMLLHGGRTRSSISSTATLYSTSGTCCARPIRLRCRGSTLWWLTRRYRWEPSEALGEDVRFKNYGGTKVRR